MAEKRAARGSFAPPEEHGAADASSAVQPMHWEPSKQDLLNEREESSEATPDGGRETSGADASPSLAREVSDGGGFGPSPSDVPRAQPPEEFTGVRIERRKEVAGGVPAVASAVRHAWDQMGLTRSARTLLRLNQKDGFDCPGCAWPDPDGERSHAEFCENGAKHVADEATTRRVTPEFFQRHSVRELAEKSDLWLNQQGRLTHPLVLRRGSEHYEPVGWDEAFRLIASELHALDSPDEAAFYTSGRTSNEAAFLYQLFVRQFGTNNLPDCSNMCHESSGTGLMATIGVGKGTVTLKDFEQAEAIFVIGQNPGTNHPRMLTTLREAKRRGCKIVHVNPLPETGLMRFKHPQEVFDVLGRGVQLSDLFLQVRVNGDVALLKG
ncbi:MAG TPA: molybdopterin-dependent oxidoreductase, partial [Pyrinomonadaceae bacterium]|nr:molybdopterin-dependent oxidoreductase [Pyrinomonadaceae bacterium]